MLKINGKPSKSKTVQNSVCTAVTKHHIFCTPCVVLALNKKSMICSFIQVISISSLKPTTTQRHSRHSPDTVLE